MNPETPTQDGRRMPGLLAVALLPFAAAGCSLRLPGRDLAMGYAAERNGMERRIVAGLDVRIDGAWPGFDAGFSDTTVGEVRPFEAAPEAEPERGPRFEPPLAWTWCRGGLVRHAGWFYRDTPSPTGAVQFVSEAKIGLGTGWHPAAPSFDLGFGRQTLVIAQPGASGTFRIDFNSRHPLDGGISTQQPTQETP